LFSGVARADVSDANSSSSSSSSSSSASSDSGSSFAAGRPDSITDKGPHDRASNLSLMGYLGRFDYGSVAFGVDGRFAIPIVKNGFLPMLNNSFSIEPGVRLGLALDGGYTIVNLDPSCYAMWEFYFNKKFSAYAGLGLGFDIAFGHYFGDSVSFFYVGPAVGIHYKFASNIAFRAEARYADGFGFNNYYGYGNELVEGGLTFYF